LIRVGVVLGMGPFSPPHPFAAISRKAFT